MYEYLITSFGDGVVYEPVGDLPRSHRIWGMNPSYEQAVKRIRARVGEDTVITDLRGWIDHLPQST